MEDVQRLRFISPQRERSREKMADAIVVVNAGSSSIKFSLFVTRSSDLELELHGQIEVYSEPHFTVKKHDGATAAEKSWTEGTKLGHDGALDYLVSFLRSELANDHLTGVGHRVVHGGTDSKGLCESMLALLRESRI